MDELNPMVLSGFGLKLKGFNRIRGAYICNTDKGVKQLKKTDMKTENIIFVHNAKQHLYDNDFKNIDMFELSLDNLPYYIFDDETYILSDYIEGTDVDLSKNYIQIAREIAFMHKVSSGVKSFEEQKNLNLINVFEKRISEMSRLKKRIMQLSSRSRLDVMILKNYEYYYDLTQRATEMLRNSDYEKALEKVYDYGEFCHGNCREENFIINKNDLYLVNFEDCENNLCIVDLVNVVRRCLKNTLCTEKDAFLMIEEYDKIKNLSQEEKKILMALFILPYKFLKVCNKYYNSRKNWVENNISYSLEQYLMIKGKNENFLKSLENNL